MIAAEPVPTKLTYGGHYGTLLYLGRPPQWRWQAAHRHRLGLARVTLDFDGSVIATGRFAEGTAVGFNRKKKGQRSYYPLFCTLAQTGQVLDVWHRPGNVRDANGAMAFIQDCISEIRAAFARVHY